MLESIIFGLAIFFSVAEVIYLINSAKKKAPTIEVLLTLSTPCIFWAFFYYLTH